MGVPTGTNLKLRSRPLAELCVLWRLPARSGYVSCHRRMAVPGPAGISCACPAEPRDGHPYSLALASHFPLPRQAFERFLTDVNQDIDRLPSQTSIEQRVGRLFLNLGVEVPQRNTDVVEAGLLDSLVLVELIADIEQEFGVELPLEDLEVDEFRTIHRLAGLVGRVA
jgi:acyl carrier protein